MNLGKNATYISKKQPFHTNREGKDNLTQALIKRRGCLKMYDIYRSLSILYHLLWLEHQINGGLYNR